MSIGTSHATDSAGPHSRRMLTDRCRTLLRSLAGRRLSSLAVALLAAMLLMTPAVVATANDEPKDAYDGGYVPVIRRVIFPSIEVGLTRSRPIPLGATCACTIDRVGLTSQFDITILDVVPDAIAMVQQLNRFNRPARPGARYVAAYIGQQYIAGPQNQAYTTTEADWKATTSDERLADAAQLLHTEMEYRPRADVYPANYVNGWLMFEVPQNRPVYLVWNYNFVGERGIWFALQ